MGSECAPDSIKRYDYRCNACGLVFDETVYYKERDQVRCKDCGEETTRLLSSPYLSTKVPFSAQEKAWKADILAANKIEESFHYGDLGTADSKTKKEAITELTTRRYTDAK